MARGPKKHLKRLNAPKHWMLDKLGGVWAPRPSTGPHKLRECLPLIILLRNRLKYALTGKEVKYILMQRLVKIDGKARTDSTYPAGFMDTISIEKTNEHFRLLYDVRGRFSVHRVSADEAKFKLCRVKEVAKGAKGVPYMVTHDGRTIRYPDPQLGSSSSTAAIVAAVVGYYCKILRDRFCRQPLKLLMVSVPVHAMLWRQAFMVSMVLAARIETRTKLQSIRATSAHADGRKSGGPAGGPAGLLTESEGLSGFSVEPASGEEVERSATLEAAKCLISRKWHLHTQHHGDLIVGGESFLDALAMIHSVVRSSEDTPTQRGQQVIAGISEFVRISSPHAAGVKPGSQKAKDQQPEFDRLATRAAYACGQGMVSDYLARFSMLNNNNINIKEYRFDPEEMDCHMFVDAGRVFVVGRQILHNQKDTYRSCLTTELTPGMGSIANNYMPVTSAVFRKDVAPRQGPMKGFQRKNSTIAEAFKPEHKDKDLDISPDSYLHRAQYNTVEYNATGGSGKSSLLWCYKADLSVLKSYAEQNAPQAKHTGKTTQ